MDLFALLASASVLVAVLVLAYALFSGAASGVLIRGRLDVVLNDSTGTGDAPAVAALRDTRKLSGPLRSLSDGTWTQGLERDLRMAESQLQPVDFISIRVALMGLGFAGPYLFIGGVFGILLGLLAAFIGFQLPRYWLDQRRSSRNKKLETQLPEALTFIANSLKAGFGLLQAMSMAADQLAHPISTELGRTVHETNVGSAMEEAFVGLRERCQSYDMDLVVTAILIQRSAGGNLAEILETVAATMRERVRIRAEIVTLTAQQQLTGVVIAMLPVAVAGLFLVVSPDYIMVLFTRTMGQVMLGAAIFLELIGVLIIRRILAIEV